MRKSLLSLVFIILALGSSAQTVLINEDFTSGIPAGWQVIDADGFTPAASVSMFNNGWIWYTDSPDTSVACTSYFEDTTGAAEDYLILPNQSLLSHSKLSWDARSVDASYPDGYMVLLSTTDSSISSFTDTLLTVTAEYFLWERRSILLDTMGFANQDVYIAFCHNTADGFILEVDDILLETSDFTGFNEELISSFKVYPNPATDLINITLDEFNSIQILNVLGQEVVNSNESQIDVSSLDPGRYFVVAHTDKGTITESFLRP